MSILSPPVAFGRVRGFAMNIMFMLDVDGGGHLQLVGLGGGPN